jgi:hypothetical protein
VLGQALQDNIVQCYLGMTVVKGIHEYMDLNIDRYILKVLLAEPLDPVPLTQQNIIV